MRNIFLGTFSLQPKATGNGQLAMGNRILEAKQVARKKIFGHFLAATTSSGQLVMDNGVLEAKQVARKKFVGSFLATGSWKRQRATGWHRQRQRALATAPLKHEGGDGGRRGAKTTTGNGNGAPEASATWGDAGRKRQLQPATEIPGYPS